MVEFNNTCGVVTLNSPSLAVALISPFDVRPSHRAFDDFTLITPCDVLT